MTAIKASVVKELRERTGCGMMECKKALTATGGDIEAAIEEMRKKGMAKNDKLASRVAAEGTIAFVIADDKKSGAIVEINCETDFVSGGDAFKDFAKSVAKAILENRPADSDAVLALTAEDGRTFKEVREELLLKLGENIQIRRFETFDAEQGIVEGYLHGNRIGVLLATEGDNAEIAKDVAMHVAAINPMCISEADVPADVLEKEKGILVAQAQESGKPMEIIEKMIQGRLRKYLAEITLEGQAFVKDTDITVGKLLKDAGMKIVKMQRYGVGEGIEKKEENFAEEVMAQVKGS
ncbi:MAG: elongation factor Ts [Gammaproteobacteria bacterium]|nr:MAG: elongation factor Ts [Gammaproteobacteria bacterium]